MAYYGNEEDCVFCLFFFLFNRLFCKYQNDAIVTRILLFVEF